MMLLVLLTCFAASQAASPVTIIDSWNGGFKGTFDVHPDHVVHGWKVHVVFSKPIDLLEAWTAKVISGTGGAEYVLENMPFDIDLNPGMDVNVDFVGHMAGDQAPTATFCIEGIDCDGSGPGPVTAAPGVAATTPVPGAAATTPAPLVPGQVITPGTATTGGSAMKYDYAEALGLSTLFYDAQRSGMLPANNPIPWRGDSAVNDGDNGHDLSGGWYDAGDNVKFNFPMAYSTWVLGWGMTRFQDAYEAAGQTTMACDMIKWPLDYFLKCWVPSENTLYVQVGDGGLDHAFWGRPENMNMARPAFKVTADCKGSDVAADTASAMAVGSIVFKDVCGDAAYAATLLDSAKSLYAFAKTHRGIYSQCTAQAAAYYGSTNDKDELAVAASWLNKATGEAAYLADAKSFHTAGTAWALSWNDKDIAADLLLFEITKDDVYKTDITGFVTSYMPGGSVTQTPCGLAYRDKWASNRYAGNAAFVATMAAADGINPEAYKTWAMSQINYLLGDNKNHISFQIGFGNNYPTHPHHRGSSCRTDTTQCSMGDPGPNPNLLKGALVGGPDNNDNYADNRNDYVGNEVACDYNAGFQSALAGLFHFAHNNDLPAAPAAKC